MSTILNMEEPAASPAHGAMADFEPGVAATLDFEAVMHVYGPRIFRFALASLRDRDEAETVTQDCFLRAFKAQSTFRGDCSMQRG